jgi:putative FmdB family regulatory protein
MPTYEYRCEDCGNGLEVFQWFNEPPLLECPLCRKGRLRRLFGGGAGFIFKGPGFYTTDYRSEDYKRKAKEEKEATSKKEEKKS